MQGKNPPQKRIQNDRFFIISEKDGTWKYWLSQYEDGKSYISAIKRIK